MGTNIRPKISERSKFWISKHRYYELKHFSMQYRMEELLDRFEVVSVADLFDMAGISCNYTDNKYGWTNLRGAKVERVSDGYIIRLPRATTL